MTMAGVVTRITLPSPKQLKCHDLPVDDATAQFIRQSRKDVTEALNGRSGKLLCVVGPCSIHNVDEALHYARELVNIRARLNGTPLPSEGAATPVDGDAQDTPGDHIVVVMRVYCEKPRTGLGWKGLLRDPHLDGSNDMSAGIARTRELLLTLNGPAYRLPCAVEFLDPLMPEYISDLVSWVAIGARTVESQIHREMASGLVDIPVGFKNSTCGAPESAVQSVLASAAAHTYTSINADGHVAVSCTPGNPLCHLVLRGGRSGPNYYIDHLLSATASMGKAAGVKMTPAEWSRTLSSRPSVIGAATETGEERACPLGLVIDCSHDNCSKDYRNQSKVAAYLCDQLAACSGGGSEIGWLIQGVMIESFIKEGNQKLHFTPTYSAATTPVTSNPPAPLGNERRKHELEFGVSVTDGCISLPETERVLKLLAESTAQRNRTRAVPAGFKRPRD